MSNTKLQQPVKASDLQRRIERLEARNHRVDGDKAWETSWARRLSIAGLTYVVVAFYLEYVVHINPWINALVPVIGFLLSTVTLSLVKRSWLKNRSS